MSNWFEELEDWFSHVEPCHDDDSCVTVTIAKGDTLSAIALKRTKDASRWTELAAVNPGKHYDDPDTLLQIGEKVNIPKSWGG
jgi:nucleoid-associated protein YgaU